MRLNLGCGSVRIDDFVGVDRYPGPATDVIADLRDLPFKDGTVTEILCQQVIEHFFPQDIYALCLEWARVMKPGGLLILETPDFAHVAHSYTSGQMSIGLARAYVCGTDPVLNTFDPDQPESYHRTLWDVQSLAQEFSPRFRYVTHHNSDWNLHFEAVKS